MRYSHHSRKQQLNNSISVQIEEVEPLMTTPSIMTQSGKLLSLEQISKSNTISHSKPEKYQQSLNSSYKIPNELQSFPCLFTTQKLKKKKSWRDGEIRIDVSNNRLSLYEINEDSASLKTFLDSKFCPKEEIDRVRSKLTEYVEFEKYLIEIDYSSSSGGIDACGSVTSRVNSITSDSSCSSNVSGSGSSKDSSKLHINCSSSNNNNNKIKYNGFKVPSTITKPPDEKAEFNNNNNNNNNQSARVGAAGVISGVVPGGKRSRGLYAVEEEELDDIWDSMHQNDEDDHDENYSTGYVESRSNSELHSELSVEVFKNKRSITMCSSEQSPQLSSPHHDGVKRIKSSSDKEILTGHIDNDISTYRSSDDDLRAPMGTSSQSSFTHTHSLHVTATGTDDLDLWGEPVWHPPATYDGVSDSQSKVSGASSLNGENVSTKKEPQRNIFSF